MGSLLGRVQLWGLGTEVYDLESLTGGMSISGVWNRILSFAVTRITASRLVHLPRKQLRRRAETFKLRSKKSTVT